MQGNLIHSYDNERRDDIKAKIKPEQKSTARRRRGSCAHLSTGFHHIVFPPASIDRCKSVVNVVADWITRETERETDMYTRSWVDSSNLWSWRAVYRSPLECRDALSLHLRHYRRRFLAHCTMQFVWSLYYGPCTHCHAVRRAGRPSVHISAPIW